MNNEEQRKKTLSSFAKWNEKWSLGFFERVNNHEQSIILTLVDYCKQFECPGIQSLRFGGKEPPTAVGAPANSLTFGIFCSVFLCSLEIFFKKLYL